MIYINYPNGRRPNEDLSTGRVRDKGQWQKVAGELTDRLKKAPDKATRDKIIDDNAHHWSELKEWLERFSHGKCWFSEARGAGFHWHVEHFRPKKEARDPDRDGYWWRAFDYRNYRLCGSVTNSKKGCYFPVRPRTTPATSPDDNCDDESYLLIDPTRKRDVGLIQFSFGGRAVPAAPRNSWEWERADASIKRYKLNEHPALLRGRAGIWNLCQMKVRELTSLVEDDHAAAAVGKHSPARQQQIETLSRELVAMTAPEAEFSATARSYLLKDERQWIRDLVA